MEELRSNMDTAIGRRGHSIAGSDPVVGWTPACATPLRGGVHWSSMLRSEQTRPSCAVPAPVASVTTPYFDLPQLTLLTGGGRYIRRGLRRHALKLALIVKPREHNRWRSSLIWKLWKEIRQTETAVLLRGHSPTCQGRPRSIKILTGKFGRRSATEALCVDPHA